MDPHTFHGFSDELLKLAALTPEEQEALKAAVRRHANFERLAGQQKLDEAGQQAMRDNVERLKQFREKSQGKRPRVDTWARNVDGAKPKSAPSGGGRGAWGRDTWNPRWDEQKSRDPRYSPTRRSMFYPKLGLLGAALGAAAGGISGSLGSRPTPANMKRIEATQNPTYIFRAKHPGLYGAYAGGVTGGAVWSLGVPGLPLAYAGVAAPHIVGALIARKRKKEQRQAQEEHAT